VLRRWVRVFRGRRAHQRALIDGEQVEVAGRFAHDYEAHLAAGALADAGIRATVAGESGPGPVAHFPEIWRVLVRRSDLDHAVRTLSAKRDR